jgi:hypothetical protein
MNRFEPLVIPSLYVKSRNEESVKLALLLTRAKSNFVVRFTGGCGSMTPEYARDVYELLSEPFSGFNGAILFGGTRMLNKKDFKVIPGITEIPPLIKKNNPDAVILGVVPKSSDMGISNEYGLIIDSESEHDFITVVHPDQDICLVVQQSVDHEASWEAEYEECINIISNLRKFASWKSLLISYNGGNTTEKEILATAKLNWPILLIKDSGGKTEKYSKDADFLSAYPNVFVAEKDAASIRSYLRKIGISLAVNQSEKLYAIQGGRS